ncbi:hypothetical protein [Staphylothermus marinus]
MERERIRAIPPRTIIRLTNKGRRLIEHLGKLILFELS